MVSEPGTTYAMAPAPGWYHQKLNLNIAIEIKNGINHCDDCEVNMPVNWKISEDTIVQPDIVVVCKPFEAELYLNKTPEIIFEILSPSTAEKDRKIKYELFQSACVKYYVIVFPVEKYAEIFHLRPNGNYFSIGNFSEGCFKFETSGCDIEFEFCKIW
jgi:Uma2 family endonuclease